MEDNLNSRLQKFAFAFARACREAKRIPGSVSVLYATKSVDADEIERLGKLVGGPIVIGENRVQDAGVKLVELVGLGIRKKMEVHMIGTLQSNKVEDAVEIFDSIDSVDSLKLAHKISETCVLLEKTMPLWVEVNFSGEESKHGFAPSDAPSAIAEIMRLPNVSVVGIMAMAPQLDGSNEAAVRKVFSDARTLASSLQLKTSMGMSDDFELAISEGSDMVRIGKAVFG